WQLAAALSPATRPAQRRGEVMKQKSKSEAGTARAGLDRRHFTQLALGALAAASLTRTSPAQAADPEPGPYLATLRERPLTIGMLVYDRMDQIDFTGPYSVLVRVPDARIHILGLTREPVRDHKGLILTPELALAEAGRPDVL